MPSGLIQRDVLRREPSTTTQNSPEITNSFRIWIIVATITSILTLCACIVLVAISISKHRMMKQQLEEARSRIPCLDETKFSKRRWMTAEDLVLEAETTREHIIRKSLASRSGRSDRSASTASATSRPETGSGDVLKYDWKEFESRLSRHSSVASLQRSKSALPDMPAPTLSRSSSPSQPPLLASRTHTELPPLLEQHPCLR